ncbi:conserved hypothetical protein [uncultured Paludibacter sp.]|nr:conserved hypothetical protein [uncultured Paludibacter sp.]
MNKTNKILIWVIALLALLNLTTIGTILYHNYQEKKDAETVIITGQGQTPLNGRFFRHELNFNNDQMNKFRDLNHSFQMNANSLIFELDSMKHQMFVELNKPKVDTLEINRLTKEIGEHHAELKHQINVFYLNLKDICEEEQTIKLQNAFEPLFYQDGANNVLRNGSGGRHRRGQGYERGYNHNNNSN